jgi:putative SOS response-associated peptidase YedK
MCNLYSMTRVRSLFQHNRAAAFEPKNAIFPGYEAPIIRTAADGERELVVLNWGFMLLQKDRAPRRVTNVRDDKILTSPFWRTSFEQRAVVWFRHRLTASRRVNGEDERPLFAFPGVWTRYRGPIKKNGENVEQEVFAFMTTEPNELTASINHERMPVLLSSPDHFETWMNGTPTEAFSLAKSFAPDAMRIVHRRCCDGER